MGTRAIHIARFDKSAIQELTEDKTATGQALAVLLLVGLCYGIGYSIFLGIQDYNLSPTQTISGTIANLIFTDFAVFVWSATLFLVGTKLFQGRTGYWQLARPLFFSTAPGTLFILIAIPFRPIIIAAAAIAATWIVLAGFVVLKNVMGFNLQRALLTSVVGLLILAFIQMTI
jgi:Yip1 domain